MCFGDRVTVLNVRVFLRYGGSIFFFTVWRLRSIGAHTTEKRILQELGASVLDRCRHMWPVQSVWPVSLVSQDRGCRPAATPASASHHRLALGPVPRALDGCAAATCTAPRAVPVRPSRASYSSLSQEQWPVANMATKRPYRACTSLMDAAIWAGPLERVRSSCLLELCPFSLLCDHCGRSGVLGNFDVNYGVK